MGKKKSSGVKWVMVLMVWAVLCSLGAAIFFKFIYKPDQTKKLEEQTSAKSQYDHEISISLDGFSGYSILRSDEFRDQLKMSRIRLNLEDDGADYGKRMQTLRRGRSQFAVFTVDSLITASVDTGEFPGTIVLMLDESHGADAVVAYKDGMTNINALDHQDARVVLTPDSPSEFMARIITSHFSLQGLPKNYVIEANGSDDVYNKFKRADPSQKKAYVMWEPDVSKALEQQGAHVLIDSAKMKGFIVDVLVVQREFLTENEPLVSKVIEAYLRAAYHHRRDMKSLVKADAAKTGGRLSDAQAEKIVGGIRWKNSVENYAHFGLLQEMSRKGLDHLEDIIERITEVLVKTGRLSEDPFGGNYNRLFYDKILLALKNSDFHPGRQLNVLGAEIGLLDPEDIQGVDELPALSADEWNRIVPVGRLDINPVSFGRGKAKIGFQSQRDLKALAQKLKIWPDYYLWIVGHARKEGDIELNRELARQRAEAVREFLVNEGRVSPNRVRTKAAKVFSRGGDGQSVSFVMGQMPY